MRTHFAEWCAAHSDSFDVRLDGFVPMEHHAKFKYLVHLDGQGLSSRCVCARKRAACTVVLRWHLCREKEGDRYGRYDPITTVYVGRRRQSRHQGKVLRLTFASAFFAVELSRDGRMLVVLCCTRRICRRLRPYLVHIPSHLLTILALSMTAPAPTVAQVRPAAGDEVHGHEGGVWVPWFLPPPPEAIQALCAIVSVGVFGLAWVPCSWGSRAEQRIHQ